MAIVRSHSLTMLDNIVTVGGLAGGVEGAASLTLTQETFKKEWEGHVGNLMAADLAMASGSGKLRSLEAMSRKT